MQVENSNDFVLRFYFSPNEFIQNPSITKRYVMNSSCGVAKGNDSSQIKKIECTPIVWNPGKMLHAQKKETQGIEGSTFMQFFTAKEGPKETAEDMALEDEEKLDMLEEDYMVAVEITDEIIPLALEYYLNIVEEQIDDEEFEDVDEGEVDEEIIDGQEVNGSLLVFTGLKNNDEKMDDDGNNDD